MAKKRKVVSAKKAKQILKDKQIRGKPLTPDQKGFFGARAGGEPVKRKRKKKGK